MDIYSILREISCWSRSWNWYHVCRGRFLLDLLFPKSTNFGHL